MNPPLLRRTACWLFIGVAWLAGLRECLALWRARRVERRLGCS